MTDDTAQAPAADAAPDATVTPAADAPPSEAPLIPVAQLIASAPDFLGCETYVAAGALHGQTDDLTVADAQALVQRWYGEE